jgi:hypothetical protein
MLGKEISTVYGTLVHRNLPSYCILSQVNPIRILTCTYFLYIYRWFFQMIFCLNFFRLNFCMNSLPQVINFAFIIYIYKSETGWLCVRLCVLLGDGSGGVSFLVSSRSVSYWQRGRFLFGQFYVCFLLVTTTMGWHFLWGPFRGGIFFGVRWYIWLICLITAFGSHIFRHLGRKQKL